MSLAAVVYLHRSLQHELVQLHHHAVAAHVHGAESRGRQAGYNVHRSTVHHELPRGRRLVSEPPEGAVSTH